jgi:hypothetical protein
MLREPSPDRGRHPEVVALLLIGIVITAFSQMSHVPSYRLRPATYSMHRQPLISTAVARLRRVVTDSQR